MSWSFYTKLESVWTIQIVNFWTTLRILLPFWCLDHCIFTFPPAGTGLHPRCPSLFNSSPSPPTNIPVWTNSLGFSDGCSCSMLIVYSAPSSPKHMPPAVCLQWECFSHHMQTLLQMSQPWDTFVSRELSPLNIRCWALLTLSFTLLYSRGLQWVSQMFQIFLLAGIPQLQSDQPQIYCCSLESYAASAQGVCFWKVISWCEFQPKEIKPEHSLFSLVYSFYLEKKLRLHSDLLHSTEN